MSLFNQSRSPRSGKSPLPPQGATLAALDLGTHNCRLLIARQDEGRLRILESFSQIVRLGEDLSQTGALSEEAMQRTIHALHACTDKLAEYPISDARFVTTEACRRASNGEAFIQQVKHETGLDLKIISHKDEAVLAFLGCAPLVHPETDYALLLDIGGGSIELLLVNMRNPIEPKISGWHSTPHGVMSLTEQAVKQGHSPSVMKEISTVLEESFTSFAEKHELGMLAEKYHMQLIGCSATVTTLGALQQGLSRYDRRLVDGTALTTRQVSEQCRRIRNMSEAERLEHACIGEGRAPYMLAGCSIMQAVGKSLPFHEITIADRGVREGIIFSLLKKQLRTMA